MKDPNYFIPDRGFTLPIGEDGFTIYYYAIMIVAGIILATVVVWLLFKRRNIPTDWTSATAGCPSSAGSSAARSASSSSASSTRSIFCAWQTVCSPASF